MFDFRKIDMIDQLSISLFSRRLGARGGDDGGERGGGLLPEPQALPAAGLALGEQFDRQGQRQGGAHAGHRGLRLGQGQVALPLLEVQDSQCLFLKNYHPSFRA